MKKEKEERKVAREKRRNNKKPKTAGRKEHKNLKKIYTRAERMRDDAIARGAISGQVPVTFEEIKKRRETLRQTSMPDVPEDFEDPLPEIPSDDEGAFKPARVSLTPHDLPSLPPTPTNTAPPSGASLFPPPAPAPSRSPEPLAPPAPGPPPPPLLGPPGPPAPLPPKVTGLQAQLQNKILTPRRNSRPRSQVKTQDTRCAINSGKGRRWWEVKQSPSPRALQESS